MRTFTMEYKGADALEELFQKKGIDRDKSILIQVFCGKADQFYISGVIDDIINVAPNAHIVGATSYGEIYKGRNLTQSCVIAISEFEKTKIESHFISIHDGNLYECSAELGKKLFKNKLRAAIVFSAGRMSNTEEDSALLNVEDLIEGLNSESNGTIIAGGMAGNSQNPADIYVFNNSTITGEGIVAVGLISDDLIVNHGSSSNWKPIGRDLEVTKVKDNLLIEIENIPAWEFYKKYLGENVDKLFNYWAQFPFMVKEKEEYVSMPFFPFNSSDPEKGLLTARRIKKGEHLRFGYGNIKDVLEDVRKTYMDFKDKPIETVFVYSCAVRMNLLKNLADLELEPFRDRDELTGFYTNGEINHINGNSVFVSETMTLLTLSENEDARMIVDETEITSELKEGNLEEAILFNLIKETGEELNDLNKMLEQKVEEKTIQIRKNAYTDQLTGLYNRKRLIKDIEEKNMDKIALFDIKGFSYLNDFYGNELGDKMLINFGNKLTEFSSPYRFDIYRLSSDVFAIMTNRTTTEKDFINLISNFQRELEESNFMCGVYPISLEPIISIVCDSKNILEKAEVNLNYAKKENRKIQVYNKNSNILERYKENLLWIDKIKTAINNDKIVPFYQPIINNKNQKTEKYESLMRLIDEKNKVVSPFFFLEIARGAGLYNQLTRIMLKKTFEQFKNRKQEFSVNLLLSDILDKETNDYIFSILKDDTARRTVFEIVESEGIEEFSEVAAFIEEVKKRGAKIAIDDFGTGYSNFDYLLKLNVDYIKIDGSIIKNIVSNRHSKIIAETIVNFASKLDIKTIGEFVSSEQIYKKAVDIGVDYSQGYFFSEPLAKIS